MAIAQMLRPGSEEVEGDENHVVGPGIREARGITHAAIGMTRIESCSTCLVSEVDLNRQLWMIEQIAPDRRVETNRDSERAKFVGGSDTRSHQYGRRMNRTG